MSGQDAVAIDHLALLTDLQARFLAAIPAADPRAPVPHCGRWRVRNLVVHLARIHHWAAGQARRRQETPLGRGPFDLEELYATCAAELRDTLADLDPAATAWTLDGKGPVSFWHRRQAHETLVHLHDLLAATGAAGAGSPDVGPAVWADTVDEVVTVLHPRQVRLGRTRPLDRTVTLVADDARRAWVLGGTAVHHRAADDGDLALVRGTARELALLVWGRADLDETILDVDGDAETLRTVLAERITP